MEKIDSKLKDEERKLLVLFKAIKEKRGAYLSRAKDQIANNGGVISPSSKVAANNLKSPSWTSVSENVSARGSDGNNYKALLEQYTKDHEVAIGEKTRELEEMRAQLAAYDHSLQQMMTWRNRVVQYNNILQTTVKSSSVDNHSSKGAQTRVRSFKSEDTSADTVKSDAVLRTVCKSFDKLAGDSIALPPTFKLRVKEYSSSLDSYFNPSAVAVEDSQTEESPSDTHEAYSGADDLLQQLDHKLRLAFTNGNGHINDLQSKDFADRAFQLFIRYLPFFSQESQSKLSPEDMDAIQRLRSVRDDELRVLKQQHSYRVLESKDAPVLQSLANMHNLHLLDERLEVGLYQVFGLAVNACKNRFPDERTSNGGLSEVIDGHWINKRIFIAICFVLDLFDQNVTPQIVGITYHKVVTDSARGRRRFNTRMVYNDFVIAMSIIAEFKQGKKAQSFAQTQVTSSSPLRTARSSKQPGQSPPSSPGGKSSRELEALDGNNDHSVLVDSNDPLMASLSATFEGFSDTVAEVDKGKKDIEKYITVFLNCAADAVFETLSEEYDFLQLIYKRSKNYGLYSYLPKSNTAAEAGARMNGIDISASSVFEVFCKNHKISDQFAKPPLVVRIALHVRNIVGESLCCFIASLVTLAVSITNPIPELGGAAGPAAKYAFNGSRSAKHVSTTMESIILHVKAQMAAHVQ